MDVGCDGGRTLGMHSTAYRVDHSSSSRIPILFALQVLVVKSTQNAASQKQTHQGSQEPGIVQLM